MHNYRYGYDQRVIVVTGAGNGIGKAHALAFAERGGSLVVNDVDRKAADCLVDEIVAAGGTAVANYDSVVEGDKIIADAIASFGSVDVLVNNAGIGVPLGGVPFAEMTDAEWHRLMDIHLQGTLSCSRAAWSIMQQNRYGRILMTTSPVGLFGAPFSSHYSAAKAATFGLMQCLSLEGASDNIHCNGLSPIAISNMTRPHFSDAVGQASDARYIAEMAVWLAHEDCAETGHVYELGGGFVQQVRFEMSEGLQLFGEHYSAENIADQAEKLADFGGSVKPAVGQVDIIWAKIQQRIDAKS